MSVDFFNNPDKATTDSLRFGICDDVAPVDCPDNPAYIDESDSGNWTAVVTNPGRKSVTFYPIDNCVEIRRPDGNMDNRCDGMLNFNKNLIFVELKDRSSQGWVGDGLKQLKITLRNFEKYHNVRDFERIYAQLCNKQRPSAVVSCKIDVNRFKDETGYTVIVDRNIEV